MLDVSVVIPVYRGEETLPGLIAELAELHAGAATPAGRAFRVREVILVWDRGPGASDTVITRLAEQHDWVRPVWLSRNFGQHAATIAGMTSSAGDWVVTMDEDGQHDPAYIGAMLDVAYAEDAQLVYAKPTNEPPHSAFRNAGSRLAKWSFRTFLGSNGLDTFHSYRLIMGEVARSAAAYTGAGVYLDVALSWVVSSAAICPMPMRSEGRPASNYTSKRLLAHVGRLVVSTGTRPLAIVSGLGIVVFLLGIGYALWVLIRSLTGFGLPQGWASILIAVLVIGGLTLFALGIIAQYLRVSIDTALGRPLYVILSRPDRPDAEPGQRG